MMPRGKTVSAIDHGTLWEVIYETEEDGIGNVYFDQRPFASFYHGVTGRDFMRDYAFGHGCGNVSRQLSGLRISVEGDDFVLVGETGDDTADGDD